VLKAQRDHEAFFKTLANETLRSAGA